MSIISVKDKISIASDVISYLETKKFFKDNLVHFITGNQSRPSKSKLILVNTLYAMSEGEHQIYGSLNVNIQDEDPLWIEYISELLQLFLDESLIEGYRLEFSTEHLFKVSQDLFFKNLKFKFEKV